MFNNYVKLYVNLVFWDKDVIYIFYWLRGNYFCKFNKIKRKEKIINE